MPQGSGVSVRDRNVPSSPAPGGSALDTIFVSIAAYRDPQLGPTLDDCLRKARWPERLRFGICWQHGPEEAPLEVFADPAFRVIDVDWRESRGACWARAEVMRLWDHERWFLQLDAHHRFVQDWDARLLEQAAATNSPKPILTTYVGPFDPDDPGSFAPEPMRMEFDRFTEDGIALFRPGPIPAWQTRTAPVRSRFVSAHFLFAPGSFVPEVPYDPGLYFLGEEITLAVRAFTHGYDLFHPSEVIAWHEYTRNYRRKHWDDHTAANGMPVDWSERDAPSRESASHLLTDPHAGTFGCGTSRSVADYEAYAGISFPHRRTQDYTRRHLEPPNPPLGDDWATTVRDHATSVVLAASEVTADAQFWYVGFHDCDGEELFRADAEREEIDRLLADGAPMITIVREFESASPPATWTLMPYSADTGWLEPIGGELTGNDRGQWHGTTTGALAALVRAEQVISLPGDADISRWYPRAVPDLEWTETEHGFIATRAGSATGVIANHTGVLVLELANGRRSVAEIANVVADAFGVADPPHTDVSRFLDIASSRALVEIGRGERNEHERTR
jgi:hypothetical protein